jgi:hypothetical protein
MTALKLNIFFKLNIIRGEMPHKYINSRLGHNNSRVFISLKTLISKADNRQKHKNKNKVLIKVVTY